MSFFSRGSRGSRRGQGRRTNAFGQKGRNKRIWFFVHFDSNSDEFNQLARTGHLFLGGQQALPEPMRPVNVPLQPHPSIVGIPLHPQSDPADDGWETNQNKPVSGNAKWPSMHENHPEPEFVVASVAPANSFTQNHPYIEVKSSYFKLPIDEKGKNLQVQKPQNLLMSTPRPVQRSYKEKIGGKFLT